MKRHFLLFLALFFSNTFYSQDISLTPNSFRLSGDAIRTGEYCFKLTPPEVWKGGTVWYKNAISLLEPFTIEMELKFGCDKNGADGIVFLFHDKIRTGRQGEGMGFGGLYPSFGVEMDTYQNHHLHDPEFDHLALLKNGNSHHLRSITRPIPILQNKGNIKDCNSHKVKIAWLPNNKNIKVFINGKLRIDKQYDILGQIFRKNPNVYWGFSAATGGEHNLHEVCLEKVDFVEIESFDKSATQKLLEGEIYSLKHLDFLAGKTTLPSEAPSELNKLVNLLKSHPHLDVYINGHTDSSGSKSQNKILSQKRAEEVARYLREQGIDKKRIKSNGHGESFPKANNGTIKGRKINRRVDVYLIDPRA